MTNRREGREGREREGERDRERGSRAKPGIQLVSYIAHNNKTVFEADMNTSNTTLIR